MRRQLIASPYLDNPNVRSHRVTQATSDPVTQHADAMRAGYHTCPDHLAPGGHVSYLQAFVIALIQGVTELFPVSSLGHSVLVPAWFGGSWQSLVTQSSQQDSGSSFYLSYIVALHCATALALVWFFRADWVRIIRGFLRSLPASVRLSLQARRLRLSVLDKDERLAWMIIFATIPVGLTGVVLEHA